MRGSLLPCTSLFAISRYASCLHGCLGFGPFLQATADPSLSYRRIFHWSIRHPDQCHVEARPDFHAVHDGAGNRSEEDRGRVILFAAGGQLAGVGVLVMLIFSGHLLTSHPVRRPYEESAVGGLA